MHMQMRRRNMALGCALSLVFIHLVSCASIPITPITQENLGELEGTWKGTRKGKSSLGRASGPVTLEVHSTAPIEATMTFHETAVGDQRFWLKGEIDKGYLVGPMRGLKSPSTRLGLHVREDGKLELHGTYESSLRGVPVTFDGKLVFEKVEE
jgi:hypothetical protein